MSEQKYCTVCKRGGHYTKDCWGPGTVSINITPVTIFTFAVQRFPGLPKAMSPAMRSAIDRITGGAKS